MHEPLLELSVRFSMGEILSDDLPQAATALLEAGWNSPFVCAVAGLLASERGDAQELFARGLSELGVSLTFHEACLLRAESYAEAIVAGASPDQRASDIYYLDRHMGPLPELSAFLLAYARGPLRQQRPDPAEVGSLEAAACRLVEILAEVAVPQRKQAAQRRVAADGPEGYDHRERT